MKEFNSYDPDKECDHIIHRIREICRYKGVGLYKLAEDAGISKSTMHDLMKGNSRPYLYTLLRLCNALEIRIEQLVDPGDGKAAGNIDPPDERRIIEVYQCLPREKQEFLMLFLDMLVQYTKDE